MYVIACITFIFGVLTSLQNSGMNSLAYSDIATDDLSSATSVVSTTQQLAQSFGVAVSALLLRFFSNGNFSLSPIIFHQTFFAMGVITFLSFFIFITLKPNDGHQMLRKPGQDKISTH